MRGYQELVSQELRVILIHLETIPDHAWIALRYLEGWLLGIVVSLITNMASCHHGILNFKFLRVLVMAAILLSFQSLHILRRLGL